MSTLPLDLRLALTLGEAALRGDLSWTEIDQVQTTLERLEDVDEARFWHVYDSLAPREQATVRPQGRRRRFLMGGRVDLDYILGVERAS